MQTRLQQLKEHWMIIFDGKLQSTIGGKSEIKEYSEKERIDLANTKHKAGLSENSTKTEWLIFQYNLWEKILNEYERVVTQDPTTWEELEERYGGQFSELKVKNFGGPNINAGIEFPSDLKASFTDSSSAALKTLTIPYKIDVSNVTQEQQDKKIDPATQDQTYKGKVLECVRVERNKLYKERLKNHPSYVPEVGFSEEFKRKIEQAITTEEEAKTLLSIFRTPEGSYNIEEIDLLLPNSEELREIKAKNEQEIKQTHFGVTTQKIIRRINQELKNKITLEALLTFKENLKTLLKSDVSITEELSGKFLRKMENLFEKRFQIDQIKNSNDKYLQTALPQKLPELSSETKTNLFKTPDGKYDKTLAEASKFIAELQAKLSPEAQEKKEKDDLILLQLKRLRDAETLIEKTNKIQVLKELIGGISGRNVEGSLNLTQQNDVIEFSQKIIELLSKPIVFKKTIERTTENDISYKFDSDERLLILELPEDERTTLEPQQLLDQAQAKKNLLDYSTTTKNPQGKEQEIIVGNQYSTFILEPDCKELTVQFSRIKFNESLKTRTRKDNNLNLSQKISLHIKGEALTQDFEPTAFTVHKGAENGGHYVCYVKENGTWFCYDDANPKEKPTLEDSTGLPLEAKQAYIVKYSKVGLEKTHPEEMPKCGIINLGNSCFANAAVAFCSSMLGFEEKLAELEKQQNIRALEKKLNDLESKFSPSATESHSETRELIAQEMPDALLGLASSLKIEGIELYSISGKDNEKSHFTTNNTQITDPELTEEGRAEEEQKLVLESLKAAQRKVEEIPDNLVAIFTLIAIKNGGIGNKIPQLTKDLNDSFDQENPYPSLDASKIIEKYPNIATKLDESLKPTIKALAILAIKFSKVAQDEMGQRKMYTGNPEATNFVDRRLKRVDVSSVEALLKEKSEFNDICAKLGGIESIKTNPPTSTNSVETAALKPNPLSKTN